ncbi:CotH kinase family protein [Candidatus Micrarchaeota archaeon]|nr:CotH kinase family protein [Candidatus Micrarchaeota archaeon]
MRRMIGYVFITAVFLAVVFCMNGVKAIVEKQDAPPKQVQDLKERICTHGKDVFCSHLPLVIIDTGGNRIEKESETWAQISVINNSYGNNHLIDKPNLSAAAVIKYRGQSSFTTFDKKQYRIEFRQEYGEEKNKKYSVMGMNAASDWVLNAPFLDRSLVRNRLIFGISRELLSWAPDTRYCEVFLDDEYQGLYLMIEPVTNEEGRLNLTDFGLASGQTAYVLQRDLNDTEENVIYSHGTKTGKTSYLFNIRFPTKRRLTKTQCQWIENDISKFERVLYSDYFDDPDHGYAAYIDVGSFVDYYIINEFTLTADAGYMSTFVYKDLDGKLNMTVWDFNNSFNNYAGSVKYIDRFYVAESNWYNRLFEDRKFTDAVVARYRELRNGVLSEENLIRRVDQNVESLGEAVDRNFEIWGYTFSYHLLSRDEQGNSRDPKSFEEAVEQLKNCIIMRGDFLDKNIEKLYQYSIN